MAKEKAQTPAKPARQRSPNYPAISLEEAVGFAKAIQAQGADRHFIPLGVAFDTWKYKEGWGNQIAAALKAYSLVETKGKTDKREVKITDAGRRIILEAPEKVDLLKGAALKPALHAELWTRYRGDLPADPVIKNYLVVERYFNRNFVDSFISQFRKTIAFAGLTEADILADENEGTDQEHDEFTGGGGDPVSAMLDQQVKNKDKGGAVTPPLKGQLPFPLYLSKTQKAILYVPASLTRKEYDLLKKQIESSFAIMEATILTDDDPAES